MTDKQNRNAPSLIAWHVAEGKEGRWTRIGAAWSHGDAKGLTLQLGLIPVAFAGRIVLRAPKPKQEAGA